MKPAAGAEPDTLNVRFDESIGIDDGACGAERTSGTDQGTGGSREIFGDDTCQHIMNV